MTAEVPSIRSTARVSIVVGLAFTEADGPAFDLAARIARVGPGGELHLVHVFDAEPSEAKARDLADHLRLYVNEKAATVQGLGGMKVGIHLRAGAVVREIAHLASEVDATFIVVGSHEGPHLKHWVVGSTAEKLMASVACSILVASPRPKAPMEHEPKIEPPCPDCVRIRATSKGARWWCDRHSAPKARAHAYSYQREILIEFHDSEVIPTGIDF